MENVTHALAGMLVAEAVCVFRRETRPELRATAYLVSALANNLPDIDIVYTWITGPKPLGSLLHHRGHTHTLLLALPGAWLLGVLIWRWFSRRNAGATPRDRRLFVGLSLAGVVLHLSMDFGNNYGVHPFWPLSSRWFYGDSIFIIEPLWWVILIPLFVTTLRKRWLQVLLTVLLAALLMACWFVPFVSSVTASLLSGALEALAEDIAEVRANELHERTGRVSRTHREFAVMGVPVVLIEVTVRRAHLGDPGLGELPGQARLMGAKGALRAAPRLRGVGRDHLDAQLPQGAPELRGVTLVDLAPRLGREPIVTAPIGVQRGK